MLISDENSLPYNIQSIDEPIQCDYFWTLNLDEQDFRLSKIVLLEEFQTPSLTLNIFGSLLELPSEWNILVYSPETSVVDMIQISDTTRGNFSAVVLNHKTNKVLENSIRVVSYSPSTSIQVPSFNKNSMLCYPIGNDMWIMVAPTDTYNKYLKDGTTVGNFLI